MSANATAATDPPPGAGTAGTAPARRRKRSARFLEIAQVAGVSTATVNRVLNEQGSVAPATRARVIAAAKQLGVPRVLPDPRHGLTRFDVVMAASPTPFFRRLDLALQRAAQMIDPRIVIHRHSVDVDDERRVLEVLSRPGHRRDGLIVALPDRPGVREALRAQRERGLPVATVMSAIGDVPGLHYAGIDNLRAGRTAGHFIARLTGRDATAPGHVLLLTHRMGYRAHHDRIQGCLAALAEAAPALRVRGPIECQDDADRCHLAVSRALREAASAGGLPLRAIYHSGAGSAGIAGALQALAPSERPVWIGHELSDEHHALLRQHRMDLVIDQDPDGQVASGLQHLLHACAYLDRPAPDEPNEFRLYCPENLRLETSYLEAPPGAVLQRLGR